MKSIILFATLCMITSVGLVSAQEKTASTNNNKNAKGSDANWEKAYEQLLEKSPELREKIENGQTTKEDVIGWMKTQKDVGKGKSGKGKEVSKTKANQSAGNKKTTKKSEVDWEQAYQQLLEKDPRVREKIENGQATKEDIIAWMKNQKGSGKEKEAAGPSDEELARLKEKLDTMVKAGTLSEEQAAKLLATMQGSKNQQDQPKDMAAYGEELKAAVQSGKMTKEQAIKAWNQAMAGTKNGKAAARPAKGKMGSKTGVRPGSFNFYAIVIGRLRSKDIELGEIEIDVDYVISELAKVNEELIGNRIKLVGISGAFLDNLLQIKRGETIKIRTGDYDADKKVLGFGYKFQVLERTPPFKPEDFGVPPKDFRGFDGQLTGKIVESAGYEVVLEPTEIKPSSENKAGQPESIKGKRIRVAGFYNQHSDLYADLHEGDTIRLSVSHRNPASDSLQVTGQLEKLEK
ncbi:MAG: hypothetical protein GY924_10590 [Planctomycetaceae bacterium]|nr:hypothetical protein [Planctomycetaceae bacterium]